MMSDQEIEYLVSHLTRLQYPHPISVHSFQHADFELMFDIFLWLIHMLDPMIPIQNKPGIDVDRMKVLNDVVQEISAKYDINVDVSHLCAADNHAVEELTKVANIIDNALRVAEEQSTTSEADVPIERTIESSVHAKTLVDDIIQICTRLNVMLEYDNNDSRERKDALNFLNSVIRNNESARDQCRSAISRSQSITNSALERLHKQCKVLISNQHGMEDKIQKKLIDIELSSKRLESLKHVRPAYMNEYEKLEKDLEVQYERYVVRLRNKDYLEGELSVFNEAAIEKRNKLDRKMKRMQKKFRDDENKILNGCNDTKITISGGDELQRLIDPKEITDNESPREIDSRPSSGKSLSEPSSEDEHSVDSGEISKCITSSDDGDSDSNF